MLKLFSILIDLMMDSFYHTILSDSSHNYFPNNTLSNFRNYCSPSLDLQDDLWEVALVKCSYIYSIPLIKKGDLLLRYGAGKRNVRSIPSELKGWLPFESPLILLKSPTTLSKTQTVSESTLKNASPATNKTTKNPIVENDPVSILVSKPNEAINRESSDHQQMVNKCVDDKVIASGVHYVYAKENIYTVETLLRHIESQIHQTKFEQKEYLEFRGPENVKFHPRIAAILGFTDCSNEKNVYTAQYKPYMKNGMTEMFIYSDLIKPQAMGDVSAPLLATTVYEGEDGQRQSIVFHHPHYYELTRPNIDSIHMYIRSESGEILPLTFGNFTAQLHFRRKKF